LAKYVPISPFFCFFIKYLLRIFASRKITKEKEGTVVPSFIVKKLINKEHILSLIAEHLGNGPIFVTGLRIGSDNQINVFLDGDEGVTIKDCVSLSRHLEKNLIDNGADFALDVSSHGATTPLAMPRQYKKHIGRELEIKLEDGTKTEGVLVEFNGDEIVLENSVRENKPIGKGKITVIKRQTIKYNQIKESKVKLKF
jgi:ribosome maturation factor RimP